MELLLIYYFCHLSLCLGDFNLSSHDYVIFILHIFEVESFPMAILIFSLHLCGGENILI